MVAVSSRPAICTASCRQPRSCRRPCFLPAACAAARPPSVFAPSARRRTGLSAARAGLRLRGHESGPVGAPLRWRLRVNTSRVAITGPHDPAFLVHPLRLAVLRHGHHETEDQGTRQPIARLAWRVRATAARRTPSCEGTSATSGCRRRCAATPAPPRRARRLPASTGTASAVRGTGSRRCGPPAPPRSSSAAHLAW